MDGGSIKEENSWEGTGTISEDQIKSKSSKVVDSKKMEFLSSSKILSSGKILKQLSRKSSFVSVNDNQEIIDCSEDEEIQEEIKSVKKSKRKKLNNQKVKKEIMKVKL